MKPRPWLAKVDFAGLAAPGEHQFNVEIPASLTSGDQIVVVTYCNSSTQDAQPGVRITIQQ